MDKLCIQQDSIYGPGEEKSLLPALSFSAEIADTTFQQVLLRNA